MSAKDKIENLLNNDKQNWKVSGTKKMADDTITLKELANSPKMKMLYKIEAFKEALPSALRKIAVAGLAVTISIGAISNLNDDVANDVSSFVQQVDHKVQEFAGIQTIPDTNIEEIEYKTPTEANQETEETVNNDPQPVDYRLVESEKEKHIERLADTLMTEYDSGASVKELKSKYVDEMDPEQQNALKSELESKLKERFKNGQLSLGEGIELRNKFSKLK
jgi:hypothetical protein